VIRIVIRKSLHSFLQFKASQLGIDDFGEVVNYLLLQLLDSSVQPTTLNKTVSTISAPVPVVQSEPSTPQEQEYVVDPVIERIAGLVDRF
jgi:hypothetical protein